MRALLVVAHGSRREASNDEIRDLAARLRRLADNRFDMIEAAFLELAEPSIPDGIQHCLDAGADEVVVLPYFLSAGRHVTQDIPAAVAVKQKAWPQYKIHLAPYLGSAGGITKLLLALASSVVTDSP